MWLLKSQGHYMVFSDPTRLNEYDLEWPQVRTGQHKFHIFRVKVLSLLFVINNWTGYKAEWFHCGTQTWRSWESACSNSTLPRELVIRSALTPVEFLKQGRGQTEIKHHPLYDVKLIWTRSSDALDPYNRVICEAAFALWRFLRQRSTGDSLCAGCSEAVFFFSLLFFFGA